MEQGEEPSSQILPEGHKPEEGLENHQNPEHGQEAAHDPHALRVGPAEVVVPVSRRDQPAEGLGLGLGDGFIVQLGVEVRCIDGKSEIPVGKQHRGDDQTEEKRDECRPAEAVEALALTVVAPRKDATRAWAARRVPVRCRIPVTPLS